MKMTIKGIKELMHCLPFGFPRNTRGDGAETIWIVLLAIGIGIGITLIAIFASGLKGISTDFLAKLQELFNQATTGI